jgi:hypothetical protein
MYQGSSAGKILDKTGRVEPGCRSSRHLENIELALEQAVNKCELRGIV